LLAVLVIVNITIWLQRDSIGDWWRLRDYHPTSSVVSLAKDDTMTAYAKRLFYVNYPSLEDKQAFNDHCSSAAEQTAVLGCYHGNRQGIYIYDVTDSRLNGVQQVTAAHEMLHQAYDRLNSDERKHIDNLLEDFYVHGLTDQTVKDKINAYKKQKDVVLVNEMHSIFGTEVRNLPGELEAYYKRYFTDRTKIIDYRDAYQTEFTRREMMVSQYDSQLSALNMKIDSNKATLETKLSYLNSKETAINQDVANHDPSQYQADVTAYNATVAVYNSLLNTTRTLINQYNQIVNDRNALALQEQQLQQALDSRLTAPATK